MHLSFVFPAIKNTYQIDLASGVVLGMQRLEPFPRHMGVDGGGGDVGMPQQHLHGAQVGPVVDQMRGKCVAQRVG
jgi:hypothetical protein